MRRREFITLLGSTAAAWPLTARAQQPAMPVIGFLHTGSPEPTINFVAAFRKGLSESGFVEGQNVTIEYRWADNQLERLPPLVADLVRRRVAVIVATGFRNAALAAKAATTTIPIVFAAPEDPVRIGLVASLARPGGNLTGIDFFTGELVAKRLELLRELVPAVTRVAVLVNPASAAATETAVKDAEVAARTLGLQIHVFNASTSRDIDAAFTTFAQDRPGALFINGNSFFTSRLVQLANLSARHAIPSTYSLRDFAQVGGLMSYGTSLSDAFRHVGVYTGRILKGEKPADLPVVQSSKFELVINAQTARMLNLTVSPLMLTIADEVIE